MLCRGRIGGRRGSLRRGRIVGHRGSLRQSLNQLSCLLCFFFSSPFQSAIRRCQAEHRPVRPVTEPVGIVGAVQRCRYSGIVGAAAPSAIAGPAGIVGPAASGIAGPAAARPWAGSTRVQILSPHGAATRSHEQHANVREHKSSTCIGYSPATRPAKVD